MIFFWNPSSRQLSNSVFKSIIFIPKSNGHRYSDVLRRPHFQTQPDRESQRDHILELVMSVQLFLNVLNTWGTAKSKVGQTFQKRLYHFLRVKTWSKTRSVICHKKIEEDTRSISSPCRVLDRLEVHFLLIFFCSPLSLLSYRLAISGRNPHVW